MKNAVALSLSFLMLILSGCELAGDIFKAGVWVGVLLMVGVIGLGVYMFSRAKQ